jgi:hypothetical protein
MVFFEKNFYFSKHRLNGYQEILPFKKLAHSENDSLFLIGKMFSKLNVKFNIFNFTTGRSLTMMYLLDDVQFFVPIMPYFFNTNVHFFKHQFVKVFKIEKIPLITRQLTHDYLIPKPFQ